MEQVLSSKTSASFGSSVIQNHARHLGHPAFCQNHIHSSDNHWSGYKVFVSYSLKVKHPKNHLAYTPCIVNRYYTRGYTTSKLANEKNNKQIPGALQGIYAAAKLASC